MNDATNNETTTPTRPAYIAYSVREREGRTPFVSFSGKRPREITVEGGDLRGPR